MTVGPPLSPMSPPVRQPEFPAFSLQARVVRGEKIPRCGYLSTLLQLESESTADMACSAMVVEGCDACYHRPAAQLNEQRQNQLQHSSRRVLDIRYTLHGKASKNVGNPIFVCCTALTTYPTAQASSQLRHLRERRALPTSLSSSVLGSCVRCPYRNAVEQERKGVLVQL